MRFDFVLTKRICFFMMKNQRDDGKENYYDLWTACNLWTVSFVIVYCTFL
jgi:hypothetical protein